MTMQDEEVVAYLGKQPGFFDHHPELLQQMTLVANHGDSVISLIERQVMVLRKSLEQRNEQLRDLIQYGRLNDEISRQVHMLSLILLEWQSVDVMLEQLDDCMAKEFRVPYRHLRLWSAEEVSNTNVDDPLKQFCATLEQPYCGVPPALEMLGCFGEDADIVQSIVLLPLRVNGQLLGVWILGSHEKHRFESESGTVYLIRIGELLSLAIYRQFATVPEGKHDLSVE